MEDYAEKLIQLEETNAYLEDSVENLTKQLMKVTLDGNNQTKQLKKEIENLKSPISVEPPKEEKKEEKRKPIRSFADLSPLGERKVVKKPTKKNFLLDISDEKSSKSKDTTPSKSEKKKKMEDAITSDIKKRLEK